MVDDLKDAEDVEKTDPLGFEPYVNAIAKFLTDPNTKPPLTLSIEGEESSGRSSFMAQLEDLLISKNEFTVSFNAWRHDTDDSLWAAFALNFIDELSSKQSPLRRCKSNIKLLFSRFRWDKRDKHHSLPPRNDLEVFLSLVTWKNLEVLRFLVIWIFFVLFTIAAMVLLFLKGTDWGILFSARFIDSSLGQFLFSRLIGFSGVAASMAVLISLMLKLKNTVASPFDGDFNKYFNAPDYEGRVDFIESFHKDFKNIVKAYAGEDKVYIFIDNLDRREVPKAADLMQTIKRMISYDPHLIFIVGMDRAKVAASIAVKYEKLIPYLFSSDSESIGTPRQGLKYGYAFIEEFIQVPFSVPKPTKDVFEKFLEDTKPEETKKEERRQTITLELNGDSKRILDIILMIAPVLDNKPRCIKQFINLFRFQTYIAVQTGLFDINNEKHLALENIGKFVAISLKWPLLLNDLYANRSLLAQLQETALDSKSEMKSYWRKEEKLMELLRFGLVKNGTSDYKGKYSLSGLNVEKLLQVSPLYVLPEKDADKSLYETEDVSSEGDVYIEDTFYPVSIKDLYMKFTHIEAGDFMMGAPDNEEGRSNNEGPAHEVTIGKPFELGTYPVTQREWKEVMGKNPSRSEGDDLPVENVSWNDVQEFIRRLNDNEGTNRYRLPSETEWEYACRAEITTRYSFGDDESMLGEYAWYADNSGGKTHPVGQKKPNPWGLHDMHGNVWEWVQDKWHDNYDGAPSDGSVWESEGGFRRGGRGGSWSRNARRCRSAGRSYGDPGSRDEGLGFRLLREL